MRLIDADAMKADLLTVDPQYETMIQWCITVLDAQPTIEPERKTGKWEQESESLRKDRRSRWKCSACGKHVLIGVYDDPIKAGLMFCPNCGAKMEGEQ